MGHSLERLRGLKHFLLDMDGTIYLGPRALPGAADLIDTLRAQNKRFLFFTNNPSKDAAAYASKLAAMGIDVTPGDILTSGEATARYLAKETPHRRVFALGTPSFEEELRREGLTLDDKDPEAVVLAFDTTLTYAKLERACLLLRAGLPYIATNPDRLCPTDYGYIPDCGAIAALLESATERTPKYVGKPNAEMIRMGLEKLGADTGNTAMVGDRIYTDMEMAFRAGTTSVLVLSGESTATQARAAAQRPDHVFPSVAELARVLRGEEVPDALD